jgi:hypothetical protein
VRHGIFALLVVLASLVTAQPALASCAAETALELARRGDVSATGVVDRFVPLGFIFASDRVFNGDLPGHVLVLGQYRPPDLLGARLFVVLRSHLPGVYSMGLCDGRPLDNPYLGATGEGRAPGPDLPVGPAAAVIVIAALALLLTRRGRGRPPAPAVAAP